MSVVFENIKNSVVLLRADLNEPIDNGVVVSTKRIDASMSTIAELLSRKNRVVLISHHSDKGQSLLPISIYIQKTFPDLKFISSTDTDVITDCVNEYKNENLIMLENTRLFGKNVDEGDDENNNVEFAKFLSTLGEYFVYDAFSVAHRKHATTVGVSAFLPHTLGPIASRELAALSKVLNPEKPELVILGGAKLSTKLPLVETFLKRGATVFLGGAMAHPILQSRGVDIKNSYTENIEVSDDIKNNQNLIVPTDYTWDKKNEDKIVDAGHASMQNLQELIHNSKTILWNGPLGLYEDGYVEGTHDLVALLDKKSDTEGKYIVVGGGDTLTILDGFKNFKCSYISLSGGAMLEYLAHGKLVGIDANI
jgi:phosphoglycerate kinase